MKRTPGALALLFAAGVGICTVSDQHAPPIPPIVDGYYVLAGDFHVHAAFGDGALAPWDARREAQRRGIDVIAVTNHNQLLAPRLHRRLFYSAALPIVLTGQEVTAPQHHILAVGISTPVDWDQSAEATIAAIQAQGGVAIAAHPSADSARDFDAGALARLDAAERAHPGMYQEADSSNTRSMGFAAFFARARQHNPRVSPVGDSDFHFTGEIGFCRTYVLTREINEAGILDALRNGRSVAYDHEGRPYGDDALVEIVERARRQRQPATSPWAARTSAAGTVLAWIGLTGLVLVGPSAAAARAWRE